MTRMWIVVGDITSSGGRVITGSSFTDIDGKPVSRIGDRATCPRHKGVFPIVDGDIAMIVDGQPVALHGSSLACGCKVLAVQQSHVFVDAGGGGVRNAAAMAFINESLLDEGPPDEQFRLVAEDGETPLAQRAYRIVAADGQVWEGITDDDGLTMRVSTSEEVDLTLEVLSDSQGRVIE